MIPMTPQGNAGASTRLDERSPRSNYLDHYQSDQLDTLIRRRCRVREMAQGSGNHLGELDDGLTRVEPTAIPTRTDRPRLMPNSRASARCGSTRGNKGHPYQSKPRG